MARISAPVDVWQAIEHGVPITMAEKESSRNAILAAIEYNLVKTSAMLNVDNRLNLQPYQMRPTAEAIIDSYPNESLEDILLCLRYGVMGKYDDKLLRLDTSVILSWIPKYLQEKYEAVEAKLQREKKAEADTAMTDEELSKFNRKIEEWKRVLGYTPKEKEAATNAKENEYQRAKIKIGYKPLTDDEVRKRELHLQWIRENIDPRTAKLKPGGLNEDEWILRSKIAE